MNDFKIAKEAYSSVIEEGKPLLHEHWQELAFYPDIPLDPDYDVYVELERKNLISIYTVRVDQQLVGYAVYFVRRHHHYRTASWAISDIILIRQSYRNYGIGNALFEFAEKDLRSQGVIVMHTTTKYGHPELGLLLKSRGHQREGESYSKRL